MAGAALANAGKLPESLLLASNARDGDLVSGLAPSMQQAFVMKHRASFLTIASFMLGAIALTGCGPDDGSACRDGACDSSTLVGTPHGLRDDGTVDVTVEQAWPHRLAEPAPLSASELANACALIAACSPADDCHGDSGCVDTTRQQYMQYCVVPELWAFWEERAVPTLEKNERWTFEAREILASGGDCAKVLGAGTTRAPEIKCEEAGCWWLSYDAPIPSVTCDGDVAHLTSGSLDYQRDCSRALQKCDASSPTGCTDRAPVACEHPAKDRCDGAVRLGCDGNGRVSFHDCARVPGGTCDEREDGSLGCLYPNAGQCELGDIACDGDIAQVCVLGDTVPVDCKALGFDTCRDGVCVR